MYACSVAKGRRGGEKKRGSLNPTIACFPMMILQELWEGIKIANQVEIFRDNSNNSLLRWTIFTNWFWHFQLDLFDHDKNPWKGRHGTSIFNKAMKKIRDVLL